MTEKTTHTFSYQAEPEGSFLKWAMVTFPGAGRDGKTAGAFIEELSDRSDRFENIELAITLNGMDVDAEAFMARLEQAMDWQVERAIKEKLDNLVGFQELQDSISDFESGFKRKVRELAAENGITMEEERW